MRTSSYCLLLLVFAGGCSSGDDAPAPAKEVPAHVEAPRPEAELTTVKLSQEAVTRLGLQTVVVRTETAGATRSLGGEVAVPEGRLVTVTAPVAGTLSIGSGTQPGMRVARGARLMTLAPLASSDRDQGIEARRTVETTQAETEAARMRLQRLEQLLTDGAASARSVEEARAQLQVSQAALNAARERLDGVRGDRPGPRGKLPSRRPSMASFRLFPPRRDRRWRPRRRCCRSRRSARCGCGFQFSRAMSA